MTKITNAPNGKALTLAIDIGGTGLKASVLDPAGKMEAPREHMPTPHPSPPETIMNALAELIRPLPRFDRISAGFPGAVRNGVVLTAPNLGNEDWARFPLEQQLAKRFERPARVQNDAAVQGFGVISGHGLEMILTLGTGAGMAIFLDGKIAPHLEMSQHPVHKKHTYDTYIGKVAFDKVGLKHWKKRVHKVIAILDRVVLFDVLYLGGGHAPHLDGEVPERVKIVSNDAGITGGVALWDASG